MGTGKIISRAVADGLEAFALSNSSGMCATILNYGATITGIEVPDREGKMADVLLGHDDLTEYVGGRFYLGATIGRFANRIVGGRFELDGNEIHVTANRNGNHLHGGASGFDKKYWKSNVVRLEGSQTLELTHVSPDGDEGFPGRLEVKVAYTVGEDSGLIIRYNATTDKPTVVNMTNHSYFNLTGSADNTILDHVLHLNADNYTSTDNSSIPRGEIRSVKGSPMDFRSPAPIGKRIDEDFDQLIFAKGYDHNWIIDGRAGEIREAAVVHDPVSGRIMQVLTDQPGIQFYSGNYLDGTMKGKGGFLYGRRSGLCLECQGFPNAPNIPTFPSTILRPGQVYSQTTVYKFSTDGKRKAETV